MTVAKMSAHLLSLLALFLIAGPIHAQVCPQPSRESSVVWSAGATMARYSYAKQMSLFAERAGHVLGLRARAGQTSSAFLDEVVPEASLTLSGRVQVGALQACAFAGGFYWNGPDRPILGWDSMTSRGAGGGLEASYHFHVGRRLVVAPHVTASWDAVRAHRERRVPTLFSDSTARYTLRTTEYGVSVTIDRQLTFRLASQRPTGMPDKTQLGPLGRTNAENAMVVGVALSFK